MVDTLILYNYDEHSFTSNGLGFLNDATKCVVEEERNGIFELELEYPMTGKRYSDIQIRNIIYCKPNPYDDPQPFRIYSISKPINGLITVSARHISYDLSDWVCLPFLALNSRGKNVNGKYYPGVIDFLRSEHVTFNGEGESGTTTFNGAIYDPGNTSTFPFTFTTDMDVDFLWEDADHNPSDKPADDHRFKMFRPSTVRSVLGESKECGILGKFIDPATKKRGEFVYNKFNIHIAKQRGTDRGFEIRYGKNLTSLDKSETADRDYTEIFPYWKSIHSDSASVKILDDIAGTHPTRTESIPGASNRYRKVLIRDLSSDFDDEPNATDMRRYAQNYITDEELVGQPTSNITVNFQSLARSSEYSKYAGLEEVRLCDTVTVIHEGLGIVDSKKVIKTTYDVLANQYTSIEIGSPKEDLSGTISSNTTGTAAIANNADLLNLSTEDTAKKATKIFQTIYYLKVSSSQVPSPPSEWLEDADETKEDAWISIEPKAQHDGTLYTAIQTVFVDGSFSVSAPAFGKLMNALKDVFKTTVDPITGAITNKLDGGEVASKTIDTAQIADEAVETEQIGDKAVTYDKIAVDAIHSGNFIESDDDSVKFSSSKTYHDGDRVLLDDDDHYGLYECIVSETSGEFNESEWKELPSTYFSVEGSKFDLESGYISSKNFAVDYSGNVFLNGEIQATGGKIGGWDIEEDRLGHNIPRGASIELSGEADLYISSSSPIGKSTDNIVFRISSNSSNASDSAIFAIGSDGKIYSTAGYLGGWEISTDGIVNTTSDDKNVYLFGKNDASHTFSSSSPIGRNLEDDDVIPTNLVMRIGSASDATFALSANGVIYATSGYLGPLRLTNDGLQYTSEGEVGSAPTSTTALKANELFIRDEAVTSSWGANTADYFRVAKSVANNRDGFIFETRVTDGDSADKAWIRMNYGYANGKEYAGYLGGIWNVNNDLIDISQPDYTKNVYINTLDDTRTYLSDDDERTIGQRLRAAESGAGKDFTLSYDGSTRKMSLNADGTSISEAEINLANASTSMDGLLDHHDKLKLNNLPTLMLTYEEV